MSEERVEQALRHLGEELRFTNPTQAVLRRTRRMRLRRNVFGGVGGALAVAAVVAPFVYLPGQAPGPLGAPASTPPATSAPSTSAPSTSAPPTMAPPKPAPPGAVALPGGLYVASASNDSGSQIYDPKLHKYRSSGYPQAWVSPNGKLAAVADDNGRLGLLDLASKHVRWVTGPKLEVGAPEWSADSRRLVFSGPGPEQDTISIVLVDAAGARARTLRPSVLCWELCRPSWLPGGQEVSLPEAGQSQVAFQAYSVADGRSRRVLLPGTVQTGDAWSPDGRYVVASISAGNSSGIGIIEAATGNLVAALDPRPEDEFLARSVVWATTDRIVAVAARQLVVFSTEGKELQRIPLPSALRGVENDLAFGRP
ncbi:hypothetical protein DFJ67_1821 [Asanoa ferruginea]|uniref:WD40 repeat protein n=1 Tax=Asanoa ferruginea TaxID=53367 RepID=A0A3D9ZEK0_9ACTN|nr:hypothetical protein [Asanoa ferruginea]REF95858.1 hypothetical protein DFJ67_1821 [Asanoa ferruginea]GIF53741.1 hypothetical protein Afe04nite_82800 [Asanoa ferruginea]